MVLLLNRVFKNNKIEKRLSVLFSLKSYFINSAAVLVIFDNVLAKYYKIIFWRVNSYSKESVIIQIGF